MKFNVEKLKKIARQMTEIERQEMSFREENRDWLALSAQFALRVRHILHAKGITQRKFAEKMNVSPSQITKILSGKENLSLQTIAKVEKVLGLSIVQITESPGKYPRNYDPYMSNGVRPYEIQQSTIDYASDCDNEKYPTPL